MSKGATSVRAGTGLTHWPRRCWATRRRISCWRFKEAIKSGATADDLGSAVAYAAFLRMAHFHVSNEFNDWDTVHNTLTAANALHQALKRAPSPELVRGVFDVAMSVYLDRFLNMPPQRIPETGVEPVDGAQALTEIQERMDVRQQVEEVSHLVSQYITGAGDPDALVAELGRGMLMEDAGFHSFQIVDAGFNQYRSRRGHRVGAARADRDGAVSGSPRSHAPGGPAKPTRLPCACIAAKRYSVISRDGQPQRTARRGMKEMLAIGRWRIVGVLISLVVIRVIASIGFRLAGYGAGRRFRPTVGGDYGG